MFVLDGSCATDKTSWFLVLEGGARGASSFVVNTGLEIKKEVSPSAEKEREAISKRKKQHKNGLTPLESKELSSL